MSKLKIKCHLIFLSPSYSYSLQFINRISILYIFSFTRFRSSHKYTLSFTLSISLPLFFILFILFILFNI